MTYFQERLFSLQDKKYAEFQVKLTPGISIDDVIGVRVPQVRELAKEFSKDDSRRGQLVDFMNTLPHKYYDENMLHVLLISQIKDFDLCIKYIEDFLPYINNWAVCDILSPKIFKKHTEELFPYIQKWIGARDTFTIRFGMEMLMSFYLDDKFKKEYLELPAGVISDEYYVNMMIAWFFATALAKQWDSTIPYIEEKRLGIWTHNKTIQKAIESYRITDEQKSYLKSLKI